MEVKPSMKYARNSIYDGKVGKLLDIYSQVLVVAADNIGATQLQNIRQGLRGDSVLLMGKNSMMQCAIRAHAEKTGNTAYLSLVPLLVGNVGVIFTKGDLKEVSDVVAKYKAGAPARVGLIERVGLISPVDFAVPPGHVDSQTSFVQELIQCFQWCSMSWEITLDPMFQGLVKYGKKLPK